MKLGRDALITIVLAIIGGVLPHLPVNGWVLTIIGIVIGIAAFIYGYAAFRKDKKNIWNLVAIIIGVLSIISAIVKIITLIKA